MVMMVMLMTTMMMMKAVWGGRLRVTLSPLLFTVPPHQALQKMLLHVVLLLSAYIPGSVHSFLFPTWPSLGIQF